MHWSVRKSGKKMTGWTMIFNQEFMTSYQIEIWSLAAVYDLPLTHIFFFSPHFLLLFFLLFLARSCNVTV